jgi:hypothetical protein
MQKWVRKAHAEWKRGCCVVALIPARTNTGWWHDCIQDIATVRFIRGEVAFKGFERGLWMPMCVVIWPNRDTRTRALCAQQSALWDAERKKLVQVIREEFPVGTKVRWAHGENYIEGVVVATARYEWSDDVTVRNSKSGKDFRKDAKDLELL